MPNTPKYIPYQVQTPSSKWTLHRSLFRGRDVLIAILHKTIGDGSRGETKKTIHFSLYRTLHRLCTQRCHAVLRELDGQHEQQGLTLHYCVKPQGSAISSSLAKYTVPYNNPPRLTVCGASGCLVALTAQIQKHAGRHECVPDTKTRTPWRLPLYRLPRYCPDSWMSQSVGSVMPISRNHPAGAAKASVRLFLHQHT